jgi:hypothetical protein
MWKLGKPSHSLLSSRDVVFNNASSFGCTQVANAGQFSPLSIEGKSIEFSSGRLTTVLFGLIEEGTPENLISGFGKYLIFPKTASHNKTAQLQGMKR